MEIRIKTLYSEISLNHYNTMRYLGGKRNSKDWMALSLCRDRANLG